MEDDLEEIRESIKMVNNELDNTSKEKIICPECGKQLWIEAYHDPSNGGKCVGSADCKKCARNWKTVADTIPDAVIKILQMEKT